AGAAAGALLRGLQEALNLVDELRARDAVRELGPLIAHELLGHRRLVRGRLVHDHGHDEGDPGRHVMRALDAELPLAPEVALASLLGRGRYDRHQQRAFADWPLDLLVPGIVPA